VASTGPVPTARLDVHLAIRAAQAHGGGGHAHRAAGDLQPVQRVDFARLVELSEISASRSASVMIFFLSARALKRSNSRSRFFVQVVAQVFHAVLKACRPECLPSTSRDWLTPTIFGPHDLVGLVVLEHAVLVDAGLVGKGVRAHDGLVGLHGMPV
jgi:hypothetical protein